MPLHKDEEVEALKARVKELEAWQLAIAEWAGYVNRAEGQGGYEVADTQTILVSLRSYKSDAMAYEGTLAHLTEVGATGHDLDGDATQGVASLVEQRDSANADRARLRGVLEQVRSAMEASDQGPDGDNDPRRPLASAVWAAIASTDASQWLRERERRVAVKAWDLGCKAAEHIGFGRVDERIEARTEDLDALLKGET